MEKEHLYMKEEIKEKEKYLGSSIIGGWPWRDETKKVVTLLYMVQL